MESPRAMRGRVPRLQLGGAALVVLAALGGCGGSDHSKAAPALSDDRRGVLATVDALQTASRQDDAGKICRDLFTPALAKSIRKASKHSCESEVHKTLTTPDAQLSVSRDIHIKGSQATATVREKNGRTSTVSFVKAAGRWRIERVTPVKRQ